MQEEKYGTRDMSYNYWHRIPSICRFVGEKEAREIAMIDMDVVLFIEYENETKRPLALIETAIDIGQPYKTATVTKNLAKAANLPGYVLLYKLAGHSNPSDKRWNDIVEFRVKQLFPKFEKEWTRMTPERWALSLLKIREWVIKNKGY